MSLALVLVGLYLPLDDRPPNWAPCRWQIVLCPPSELYRGPIGIDYPELRSWLLETSGEFLLVSWDALAYGGLLQSRSQSRTPSAALVRAGGALIWKSRYQGELQGFWVLPRYPDARYRERNLSAIQRTEPWEAHTEVVWDDALPPSPAPREASGLAFATRPGADEAAQVQLLAILRPGLKVKVLYDDPQAAWKVTPYEGIPLYQTVAGILNSSGAQTSLEPDLVLYIYTGQAPARAIYQIASSPYPVAVADIARVNRADPRLLEALVQNSRFGDLASYAAWGTPANNIGSALAQAGLLQGPGRLCALAESYLQYRYSQVRGPLDPEAILELLNREPFPELASYRLELQRLELPWQRSFEADFGFSLHPPVGSALDCGLSSS